MYLKINFTDFWSGFDKTNNYFYYLLSKYYDIIISEDPDILFYSCYSEDYLKYDCIRIYYTGENLRPDFTSCDYALTFDYIKKNNHFRLPLYGMYALNILDNKQLENRNLLFGIKSPEQIKKDWAKKTKFCCMVVSNEKAKERINFFHALSKFKTVDSGGRVLNNIGGPIEDKMSFISTYKFVFAFENSSSVGYTTEKILEPLSSGSIPIYWGNPLIGNDFNSKRFINYNDFASEEALIDHILEIDSDDEKAFKILSEPIFPNNTIPDFINPENVLIFLQKIINNRNKITPIARTSWRYIHFIKVNAKKVNKHIKSKVTKSI